MQFIIILLLSATSLVAYGISHDQIAAHLFGVSWQPFFGTSSPMLPGLGWGMATGVLFGLLLAMISRLGRTPALEARNLVRPLLLLMVTMACAAFVAGIDSRHAALIGALRLPESLAAQVPVANHVAVVTQWAMRLASYAAGVLGAVVLFGWAWRRRKAAVRFVLLRGLLREAPTAPVLKT